MKISKSCFLALTLAVVVGCAVEEQDMNEPVKGVRPDRITVSHEPLSKVNLNGFQPVWGETDAISLFYGSDTQYKYVYSAPVESSEGNVAYFTYGSVYNKGTSELKRNYAVYPYRNNDNKVTFSGIVTGRIINSQPYSSDNNLSHAPMVAVSDSKEFVFRNVASVIRFNVMKSDDFEGDCLLEKIKLSSASKYLSGTFEVDTNDDLWTAVSAGDARNRNVNIQIPEGGIKLGIEPVSLYMSVFPGEYSSDDLIIDITYNGGLMKSVQYNEKLILKPNSVQDINCIVTPAISGESKNVRIDIDCAKASSDIISGMIFGSFSEMHGGDLIPGICEQYIVNTSFEPWNDDGLKGESKNELVFTGNEAVKKEPDVAYPWEKRQDKGVSVFSVSTSEKINTSSSQKIVLESGATAVLLQRLALPYYRIGSYKTSFYAKVEGNVELKVSYHDTESREAIVLSDVYSPEITKGAWKEYSHVFTLDSGTSLFNNRHTKYNLWIEMTGTGTVYLDHVTVFPSDCIEGIFNPETVEYFRQYNVKSIRWPGGNYTSGYNWKNGIGPWVDRPCLPNLAWGGLDPNFLGTDEIVRFCELTGAELVMGIGYNPSVISKQDIVDWVEYCNGASSSGYGAKRASNGHASPYDVKYWGVGNEVYGAYQLGYAAAATYASDLSSIADGMRDVDSDISILASMRAVHSDYRGLYKGWTETIFSSASSAFDIMDCHMYVYGNDTNSPIYMTGEGYFRAFAAANLTLRDFLDDMRRTAPGKPVAFLEWGVLPKLSGSAYRTPQRQTFANLLISACEYHEMIRNSDIVKMAAMHNFSIYVSPQKLHSEPVNMRTRLIREMSAFAGGYPLVLDTSSVPTYKQDVNMVDIGVRNSVPEIDVVAVLNKNVVYLSCVNRSQSDIYTLDLNLLGAEVNNMTGKIYTCTRPYDRSLWDSPVNYALTSISGSADDNVDLLPMSYTILTLPLAGDGSGVLNDYVGNGPGIEVEF